MDFGAGRGSDFSGLPPWPSCISTRNWPRPGSGSAKGPYLTVTVEGDDLENNPVQIPSLMPYFQLTGQNGPSMSTQMSIINGKMSKRSTLVCQYELLAMKAGKFTIPKLTFRSGSQTYFTSPIQVEILEPQNAAQTAPPASKGTGAGIRSLF